MPFDGTLVDDGQSHLPELLLLTRPTSIDPSKWQPFEDRWWDPGLRAQLILAELASSSGWRNVIPDPPQDDEEQIRAQIKALLDKRSLRTTRLPEIIAQADLFVDIWYQTLMADAGRRPYTATLVQVGVAFGQMVGMFWKNWYKKARPAQYYPALMPVIPTPAHPSYPSNHSLQCHLILHCVLAGMPCNTRTLMEPVLRTLADRIALNREIAGVHFSEDTDAGSKLAERLFHELELEDEGKFPELNQVKNNARAEWNDNLKPGVVPDETCTRWYPLPNRLQQWS